MQGFICKRELLRHPFQIVRAFGWRVWLAGVVSRRNVTFLDLLTRYEVL
jgi:hypothetical protein